MNNTSSIRKQQKNEVDFSIRLDWLEKKRGLVTSDEVKDTIRIAMPPAFGGEGREWSPEHLYISSIAGCFMNTYLYFAGMLGFNVSHFICEAKGKVSLSKGKYVFTRVAIYPKIYIADEAFRAKAQEALEKAAANSLVVNSCRAVFSWHAEVILDLHPKFV